ncbi:MAG: hypothetical protein AAF585_21815, partial [Verrucomicrobiota bacterium]
MTRFHATVHQLLADALHQANQWQMAYDRGQKVVNQRRAEIYADWCKYMVCNYRPPHASRDYDYPVIDDMKALIDSEIGWLNLLQSFVGRVSNNTGAHGGPYLAHTPGLDPKALSNPGLGMLGDRVIRAAGLAVDSDEAAAFQTWMETAFVISYQEILQRPLTQVRNWNPLLLAMVAADVLPPGSSLAPDFLAAEGDSFEFTSVAEELAGAVGLLAGLVGKLKSVSVAAAVAAKDPAQMSALGTQLSLLKTDPVLGAPAAALETAIGGVLHAAADELKRRFALRLSEIEPGYQLQKQKAPRFWQPADPVLLLSGKGVEPTSRHGEDGDLRCTKATITIPTSSSDLDTLATACDKNATSFEHETSGFASRSHAELATKYIAERNMVSVNDPITPKDPAAFYTAHQQDIVDWMTAIVNSGQRANNSNGGDPWHVLMLEWRAGVRPMRTQGNVMANQRRYGHDLIRDNYELRETNAEFLRGTSGPMLTTSTSVFTGRAILTPHGRELLERRIDDFLESQVEAYLKDHKNEHLTPPAPEGEAEKRRACLAFFDAHKTALLNWRDADYQASLVEGYLEAPLLPKTPSSPIDAEDFRSDLIANLKKKALAVSTAQAKTQLFNGTTPPSWGAVTLASVLPHSATPADLKQKILDWYNDQSEGSADSKSPLRTVSEARDEIQTLKAAGVHFQSQALDGFNHALLMLRNTLQLPVSDPLGFPDYKHFSDHLVKTAVGSENRVAPAPELDFHPIRTGNLHLMRLRLADTFGRIEELPLNDPASPNFPSLVMTEPMEQFANLAPNQIGLPPRITQPARVNFRWLSAADDSQEANAHPFTSPVCGWILPNHLDGSLMIYDQDGIPLGYIDGMGKWRSTPGRVSPILPEDIANPHLSQMVVWICERAEARAQQLLKKHANDKNAPFAFMNDLLAVCD